MSNFKKSFAKPRRWSLFLFINILFFFAIIGFIGFKNRQRYKLISNFLQNQYRRFSLQKETNSSIKDKNLAFQDIQVIEKDNYLVINCVLCKKIDNYYLFINQMSEKIKSLDPKYEIHCNNSDNKVQIQIFPIVDKEDVKKIILMLENILLP